MLPRCLAVALLALAVSLVVPVAAQEAPAAPAKVARISGGVIAGNILTKVQPVYPPEPRRRMSPAPL